MLLKEGPKSRQPSSNEKQAGSELTGNETHPKRKVNHGLHIQINTFLLKQGKKTHMYGIKSNIFPAYSKACAFEIKVGVIFLLPGLKMKEQA